jgi:hypothetical protein
MKKIAIIILLLICTRPCFATYFIEGRNHGDKLTVSTPNELGFGTGDFTLCIWVRGTSSNGYAVYWLNGMIGAGIRLRLEEPYESDKPWFGITDNSLYGYYSVDSSVSVKDGAWHLITITCDRDNPNGLYLFVDGIDRSTGRYGDLTELASYNFAFNPPWSSVNLDFFYYENSLNYLQIDQFRLYKGVILTQPQIAAVYANGVGTPVIESEMESLSGFYYFEFEEGIGNPVGRYWNGTSWSNSATVNTGLLWQFGGVDPWNQYERNGDCFINFIDFSIFAQDWLKTEPGLESDFDFSGTVDINDLDMFVNYWLTGSQGQAPAVQAVSFSLMKNTEHTFDINATDTEALVYSIESLPTKGTVWDVNGSQITTVPRVLSSKTVRYVAGDYNNVADSFTFAADDKTGFDPPCGGKVTATATIFIQGLNPPGKATVPVPDNNAVSVAIDSNLSWTPGAGAVTHRVYFGTDANNPNFQTEQAGTLFDPNNLLAYSTVYWWRIDSNGPNGVTTGDLWKFTTRNEPVSPINPVAYDVAATVYTFVTSAITLSASDDGEPNPPGRLEYIITSLPANARLQDPCSGSGVIDGNMLPYTLSFFGDTVWFATESNSSPRTFTFKAYDGNAQSNTATATITIQDHPRDLLSFDGLGIVEFNDSNYYDVNNGWAIDFWVRTREPFTGLFNKRDVNQGWEIGITSGKPKIYIYDVNGLIVAEARSEWRIDNGRWHEVAFNFNQDINGIYLVIQSFINQDEPQYYEEFTIAGNFGSIENDCNLQLGFNSKQGYRGDIDMLRFFSGITNPAGIESIIQGLWNRTGEGALWELGRHPKLDTQYKKVRVW